MAIDSTLNKYTTRSFAFVIALGIFTCSASQGGPFHTGQPEKISFSPDNSKIAFIWSDEWYMPVVDSPILKREISLCWCNVADVDSVKSIKVYSASGRFYGPDPMDFKFSPDSSHLAIFTPNYLSVINLKSKKLWRLSNAGEKVTSFQWLDNAQIGYCVHAIAEEDKSRYERTFWRQKIANAHKTRSRIYSASIVEPDISTWPQEYWSPKGRYVIFLRNPYRTNSRFQLLDAGTGTTKLTFGQPKSVTITFGIEGDSGISWKLDGSEAFCIAGIVGKGDNQQAFLIHTDTGQIFDFSQDFAKSFRSAPYLLPCWTVDGKYVLANNYAGVGGCLIQPRPWKVVTVGKQLPENFNCEGPCLPIVFPLYTPNWVGINAPELHKSPDTGGPPKFAVDCEGRKFVPLFSDPGIYACSPDGKHAAVIWRKKKITLHKLELPEIKTTTTP